MIMNNIWKSVRSFIERLLVAVAGIFGAVASIPPLKKWAEQAGYIDPGWVVIVGVQLMCLSLLLALLLRLEKHFEKPSSNLSFIAVDEDGSVDRCSYVDVKKPRTAKLLEMSGHTVNAEIKKLSEYGKVELLLMHPAALLQFPNLFNSANEYRKAISDHLVKLQSSRNERKLLEAGDSLSVRYYRLMPGIRGRRFGNRIELSWYCMRHEIRQKQGTIVFGHCNPTIVGDSKTEEGAAMCRFFDDSFSALWNTSSTLTDDEWQSATSEVQRWIESNTGRM